MHTTIAPHDKFQETMITTDIDFTVDLDQDMPTEPPAFTSTQDSRPQSDNDVPFHDEVPAAPREARMPIAPGRVLCDRFVLTKLLGSGGTSLVFLARDLEADQMRDKPAFVALKTPRPDSKDPVRAVERLQREYEHAKRLSHTGIVQVFELGCEGDTWFVTMEMLEGESLATIFRRQATALPPYLARRVLRGIADALAYAHSGGIVHGDLNPANVFVMRGERVKLLDFGASRSEQHTPAAAATLAYASPQVIEGSPPQTSDDIFGFACIAYQALTGGHPFQQRPSVAARDEGLRPESPPSLSNEQTLALMAALSWEREARPTAVKELAKTLAPDAQRQSLSIESDDIEPMPLPRTDTRWWLLGGACLIAMFAAVALTRLG